MAIKITDDCINCGACINECPNTAIYNGGHNWRMSDGTESKDDKANPPISNDVFFIAPDKCTECVGFHEEQQCVAACPIDCCIPDLAVVETKEELLKKKEMLHSIM